MRVLVFYRNNDRFRANVLWPHVKFFGLIYFIHFPKLSFVNIRQRRPLSSIFVCNFEIFVYLSLFFGYLLPDFSSKCIAPSIYAALRHTEYKTKQFFVCSFLICNLNYEIAIEMYIFYYYFFFNISMTETCGIHSKKLAHWRINKKKNPWSHQAFWKSTFTINLCNRSESNSSIVIVIIYNEKKNARSISIKTKTAHAIKFYHLIKSNGRQYKKKQKETKLIPTEKIIRIIKFSSVNKIARMMVGAVWNAPHTRTPKPNKEKCAQK